MALRLRGRRSLGAAVALARQHQSLGWRSQPRDSERTETPGLPERPHAGAVHAPHASGRRCHLVAPRIQPSPPGTFALGDGPLSTTARRGGLLAVPNRRGLFSAKKCRRPPCSLALCSPRIQVVVLARWWAVLPRQPSLPSGLRTERAETTGHGPPGGLPTSRTGPAVWHFGKSWRCANLKGNVLREKSEEGALSTG